MKKSELKPVYIHEANYSSNNEISLVDLALILLRRKITIGLIFIAFMTSGVFYSLSQKATTFTTYNYETSIYIGRYAVNTKTKFLEPPTTLLSTIKYLHIPLFLSNSENKYTVTAGLPSNSGTIILKTSSPKANDTNAIKLLTSISNKAIADHNQYYDTIKLNLSQTIEKNNAAIEYNVAIEHKDDITTKPQNKPQTKPQTELDLARLLKINLDTSVQKINYKIQKANLDTRLHKINLDTKLQIASLKRSSTLDEPRVTKKTITTKPPQSIKVILAITIFGGLLTAIFVAFFAEFLSKLKSEIKNQKSEIK